jgi:hypothetical protein
MEKLSCALNFWGFDDTIDGEAELGRESV